MSPEGSPNPAARPVPPAFVSGILGRCPQCGRGALFKKYLHIAEFCGECGSDFRSADSGDGPAVFVMLAAGAIAAPLAILFLLITRSILWTAIIFIPLSVGLCLALLPPFKDALFALQWTNRAAEARAAPRHEPEH